MSEAVQPAETPAAPATPPPEAPAEPEIVSLDDALDAIEAPGDAPEPEAPAEPEPEPSEAPETPEEPPPAAAKPPDPFKALEALDAEKLSSPEALAAAVETVKAARKAAQEVIATAHDRWVKAEKREGKLNAKLAEWKRDRDFITAYRDEQHALTRQMRNGDAAARWQAFDRWARQHADMSGQDLYTEYSIGLGGKGPDPRDALIQELKAKVDQIEHGTKAEREAQQLASSEFNARGLLASGVKDAGRFPALAAKAKEWGFAETCVEIENGIRTKYGSFGQHIDIGSVLAQAELHLRNEMGLVGPSVDQQKPPAGYGPEAGREPSAAAAAKPDLARRTPGKSVTPSLAGSPATRTRSREDGESTEELAADPAFLQELGLL